MAFTGATIVVSAGYVVVVGNALTIGASAGEVAVTFCRNAALGMYYSGLEEVCCRNAS